MIVILKIYQYYIIHFYNINSKKGEWEICGYHNDFIAFNYLTNFKKA